MTTYQRIADSLRRRLLKGTWKPGERLPTERQLCQQFDASQITIRRALEIMEQECLVERRQGSGTFVTGGAMRKIPIVQTDFFGSIRCHAPRLERRLHQWQWATAGDEVAGALLVCVGDHVLEMVRIDELHGEPVSFDKVTLAASYADRLSADDLAELDFLRRWQSVQGIQFDYCTQTIEAVKATSPASRWLHVRTGEPLLKESSLIFLTGNRPAGLFVSYYRHDAFRFDATFSLGQYGLAPRRTRGQS